MRVGMAHGDGVHMTGLGDDFDLCLLSRTLCGLLGMLPIHSIYCSSLVACCFEHPPRDTTACLLSDHWFFKTVICFNVRFNERNVSAGFFGPLFFSPLCARIIKIMVMRVAR